jgi:hypothetical protein
MRVNIYAEELTEEVRIVESEAEGKKFYGVRFFLKSHNDLHFNEKDDDRSAVTFWVPYTKVTGHDFNMLSNLLVDGSLKLDKTQEKLNVQSSK